MIEHIHTIKYGSVLIDYDLSFQERKNLTIKVYPDCSVKIIAPYDTPLQKIEKQIKKKAPWIIKQQREFLSYQPLTPPRLYVNGETHLYLGRQYKLRIERGNKSEVKLFRGRIIVFCKEENSVKEILNKWYREKAVVHFEEVLNKTLLLFKKYDIIKPELHIRSMEKRWGSCTPNGKIILNSELIKAPKGSIEYVIVHELCHLIYYNHTKAFYDLQESIMLDWKKWKERLENILS
ncbi:M48 family metallopeptidase [Chryseobacterium sp. LC2016-27]|uniref:M48 family metallopeptidase n=1 Tax=Chryseobacterium sp. LC2016-27 TaxID=2897326 RepID=UPI001E398DA2|nr:SprT family zinc-dependent metalloprotease [Chryseobacterium sp. LC2016-27]MCD0455729.1 M48 family metallopeptidase [Chryseobacterium sp. LC2016-27]